MTTKPDLSNFSIRTLVNPKIKEHRGRVVKNTGDGMLAEFASVVDAVRCAVEIQRGMVDREPEVPEELIEFRMGINLGDIIVEQDDIYGDRVNMAARLAATPAPAGSRRGCQSAGKRVRPLRVRAGDTVRTRRAVRWRGDRAGTSRLAREEPNERPA